MAECWSGLLFMVHSFIRSEFMKEILRLLLCAFVYDWFAGVMVGASCRFG